MEQMNIEFAKYSNGMGDTPNNIKAIIDGKKMCVPLDPANRHYAEIMRQVEAGELTIEEAE